MAFHVRYLATVCSRFLSNQYPYNHPPSPQKNMIPWGKRSHRCERPMVSHSENYLNMVDFPPLCERLPQDIIPPAPHHFPLEKAPRWSCIFQQQNWECHNFKRNERRGQDHPICIYICNYVCSLSLFFKLYQYMLCMTVWLCFTSLDIKGCRSMYKLYNNLQNIETWFLDMFNHSNETQL